MTAISHKLLVTVSEILSSLLTIDLVFVGGGKLVRCYASQHVVHLPAYEYLLRQGNTKAW